MCFSSTSSDIRSCSSTSRGEVLHALNEVVRQTEQVRTAEAAGKLIRLPSGEGMALVFRDSPEAPAHCALEISAALKTRPEVQVRMGIHSGRE